MPLILRWFLQVDTSKGPGHAMCFSLKVSCCPCCVQPCTDSRKAAWRRLFRSASWWIAVLDVIMLIVSIAIQGFAPPSANPMLGPPGNVLNMLQVSKHELDTQQQCRHRHGHCWPASEV